MPNEEIFTWDSFLENDSEFPERTIFEDGDYDYRVTNVEKTFTKKDSPMAKLTLEISDEDGNTTLVWDNLVIQKNCEWKLSQFFRSIGQKKHGERCRMDWSKVNQSTGRCKIIKTTYTNKDGQEVEKNEIDRYYDPPETKKEQTDNNDPWA